MGETGVRPPGSPAPTGPVARAVAWAIVALRWVLVPGWIVLAVAATVYLPALGSEQEGPLSNLIPTDAPALQAEARSLREFSVPVLARTVVVQRNPRGLSLQAQARALERALEIDRRTRPDLRGIAGAIPLANTLRLLPGSRESGTTVLTYLFFTPDSGLFDQVTLAHRFVREEVDRPDDALVGVTGAAQARFEQGDLIDRSLPYVELATVLSIAAILGFTYRAVGAPLLTLCAAGVAYLVSIRIVAWAGQRAGITVPQELEPVIVVLLLGVITDYSIFFLTGMRNRLGAGDTSRQAARWTTAAFLPIVVTAGLTVAGGTAALLVARLRFLRAFGPALALTVLVTLLVAVTFVPAALAMFGRLVFWPTRSSLPPTEIEIEQGRGWRAWLARLTTSKPVAAAIAAGAVALLVAAALGLAPLRLGFSLTGGLPNDDPVKRATEAAAQGFAPGIVSPTMILLEGRGLAGREPQLGRLQQLIDGQPGVAGVLGPAQQPSGQDLGLAVSKDGNAARYVVILRDDPLSGLGVRDVDELRNRMPAMLGQAGLGGVRVSFAGDTALVQETIQRTFGDLVRIGAVILLVDLLLLALLLRALVAPLYLLATSVLALLASMGLTVVLFQRVLHHPDLTYYVPVAAAVLLVSLGSDYNIFVAGRIWDEARTRPLREAIALGSRRATKAVTIAGLTLAASFATLAIVPLTPFRELAFALGAGVLIDSFLVRSMLVPALISLFGRTSTWPGRAFGQAAAMPREQTG
jgi:RND superfamily putative drug exporter